MLNRIFFSITLCFILQTHSAAFKRSCSNVITPSILNQVLIEKKALTSDNVLALIDELAQNELISKEIQDFKKSKNYIKIQEKWNPQQISNPDELANHVLAILKEILQSKRDRPGFLNIYRHSPNFFLNRLSTQAVEILHFEQKLRDIIISQGFSLLNLPSKPNTKKLINRFVMEFIYTGNSKILSDLKLTASLDKDLQENGIEPVKIKIRRWYGPQIYARWVLKHAVNLTIASVTATVIAIGYIADTSNKYADSEVFQTLSMQEKEQIRLLDRAIKHDSAKVEQQLSMQIEKALADDIAKPKSEVDYLNDLMEKLKK